MTNLYSLRIGRALLAALALGFVATSAALAADGTRYYVNDYLATTVGIADAAGEIAALEADAFGSPLAGGSNAGRFTGKPYDGDLGAYVFPFRNYRADEGRWMSADPSGFPDGTNSARYAPSPTFGVDPLGLLTVTVTGGYANNPSSSFTYSVGIAHHSLSNLPSGQIGGQKTTVISPSGIPSSGFWVQEVAFKMNGQAYDHYYEAARLTVGPNSVSVTGRSGVSISPFVDEFLWRFSPPTASGSATIQGWANFYTYGTADDPAGWINNVDEAGAFYSTRSQPANFSRNNAIYSWMKISWE